MEPLIPGYFHIYNHAVGNELLIREEKNYLYFIDKFKKYVVPIADVYSYCLMPNHIHLLIRIKDDDEIISLVNNQSGLDKGKTFNHISDEEQIISYFLSKQFSNLFSSYAQAYNRLYNRRGSLFIKNFKRKKIEEESYFIRLVNYIHFNPVAHGFVDRPSDWKYSSYNAIISDKPSLIKRDEVLECFDGLSNFMYNHLKPLDI